MKLENQKIQDIQDMRYNQRQRNGYINRDNIMDRINITLGRSVRRMGLLSMFFIFALLFLSAGPLNAQSDKDQFDRARLALFDRQWDEALTQLDRLSAMYPKSSYIPQVYFYKGKCWEEKKDTLKALENYTAFLRISTNDTLKEEASRAVIDLNFILYQAQRKANSSNPGKATEEIINFLNNKQLVVKYYAAFKLSYIADKAIASYAVPVLKSIIENESDSELVERAKIALMRINPELLKKSSKPQSIENRLIVLSIYDKKSKTNSVSITIPFALARLALESIPDKDKTKLTDKGYDITRILDTLAKTGQLFKLEDEDITLKIWLK